jgi:hypothetical protein
MMQVIDYTPALPGQWYIAEFSIYFSGWGMTFHKWKLRQSNKGTYWVQGPSYGLEGNYGNKEWHPYIDFIGDKKKEFERKLIEQLKVFLKPL